MTGEVTVDAFLDGRLVLEQPAKGHRIGTDAMLLAAAAPPGCRQICDLGSGVGAVGIAAALASPESRVTLVDNSPDVLELAIRNVARAGLSSRVAAVQGDVFARQALAALLPRDGFDLVLTNPPFLDGAQNRAAPDPLRRAAHTLDGGTVADWLSTARALLAPRGLLVVIHRADALRALLAGMERGLGGITLLPVYPRAGVAATRLLAGATKGSRAALALRPALTLHETDGRFTPEAEAVHRGLTRLTLFA